MKERKVVAPAIDTGISAKDRAKIAAGLSQVLADTYTVYLKTHNFHWNVTGPMFNTLHLMFETQYNELALAVDLIAERIRALGYPAPGSYSQYAKLSSIKEETSVPEEYPLVAAVFVNRLKKGMRLQTDPTVIYALGDGKGPIGRPLTRVDLGVEHPYNTYLNDGLPPGPIANPGRQALEAAVNPAEVDYLYFVADGSGGHAFARTLDEHNRNVRRWRRIQRDGG